MQTLTLARFRLTRPRGPFRLGGEYTHSDGIHILLDPFGSLVLNGEERVFDHLEPGDLVILEVAHATDSEATVTAVERVTRAEPSSPVSPHVAAFARFIADIRDYFALAGCAEIRTPTLVPCPGLEPSLEPFQTEARKGSKTRALYLPTSPEIHLKKVLAKGFTDIFEIKNCFRNGEYSEHHDHEFTMLEWYRGFADLDLVIEDLRGLLKYLTSHKWCEPVTLQVTDFATLFREHLDFRLTPMTTAEELRAICPQASPCDTFTDLFHRLLIDKIEPALPEKGALVIRRFPPELAALAKLDREGWADRFEFYWNGLEIANAFNEVTDPEEQERRWQGEQRERVRLNTSPLPIDPEMIEGLRKGIPPTGGIALGVERLYMACRKVRSIGELKLFPGEKLFL